jgi:hypothetical protein
MNIDRWKSFVQQKRTRIQAQLQALNDLQKLYIEELHALDQDEKWLTLQQMVQVPPQKEVKSVPKQPTTNPTSTTKEDYKLKEHQYTSISNPEKRILKSKYLSKQTIQFDKSTVLNYVHLIHRISWRSIQN